jgi:hypothetical protein
MEGEKTPFPPFIAEAKRLERKGFAGILIFIEGQEEKSEGRVTYLTFGDVSFVQGLSALNLTEQAVREYFQNLTNFHGRN